LNQEQVSLKHILSASSKNQLAQNGGLQNGNKMRRMIFFMRLKLMSENTPLQVCVTKSLFLGQKLMVLRSTHLFLLSDQSPISATNAL
jgi:hypothetical protein